MRFQVDFLNAVKSSVHGQNMPEHHFIFRTNISIYSKEVIDIVQFRFVLHVLIEFGPNSRTQYQSVFNKHCLKLINYS